MKNFLIILSILISVSCSEYQKILKGNDYEAKYKKGLEYYNKKDYYRASTLFEELIPIYRGTAKAEEVAYYYAYCIFGQSDYIMAAYYFDNYVRTYPFGKHREQCDYLSAYCDYLNSPIASLDQTYTKKAIERFQLFINRYPSSDSIKKANQYIEALRNKLEEKSYNNAKLYYNLGDYKSAIIALNNSINEYPDSEYREELMFLVLKSSYLLAQNSIESKKKERYQATIKEYNRYISEYNEGKYSKEAQKIFNESNKIIQNY